jgi:hypothetical protein
MSKSSEFRMTAGVWARIGILAAFSAVVIACGGSSDNNSGGGKKTATPTPTATTTPSATPTVSLTICPQDFALCAASTCVETGGTITQNDGQTFPAVTCSCPVIHGPGIADVNAGNMKGSCEPPAGGVWSIYWPKENIPQAAATPAWSEAPAPFIVCSAGLPFGQCWNFACTLGEIVDGQQLANCTCPEETTTTLWATQGGFQGEPVCSEIPVGGALPN